MRGRAFPKAQMTGAQAMTQLKRDLASMPDDRLFAATVDSLIHRYKVQRRELERVLLASQENRRRFLASNLTQA
jgi:acetyl-CoA acetyltransferase